LFHILTGVVTRVAVHIEEEKQDEQCFRNSVFLFGFGKRKFF
jgi:hypothetical protein